MRSSNSALRTRTASSPSLFVTIIPIPIPISIYLYPRQSHSFPNPINPSPSHSTSISATSIQSFRATILWFQYLPTLFQLMSHLIMRRHKTDTHLSSSRCSAVTTHHMPSSRLVEFTREIRLSTSLIGFDWSDIFLMLLSSLRRLICIVIMLFHHSCRPSCRPWPSHVTRKLSHTFSLVSSSYSSYYKYSHVFTDVEYQFHVPFYLLKTIRTKNPSKYSSSLYFPLVHILVGPSVEFLV